MQKKEQVFKLVLDNEVLYFKNNNNFNCMNIIQYFRNNVNKLNLMVQNPASAKYLDGGVHYSWFGSINKIKYKFDSIAEHDIISEFNSDDHIKNCLSNNTDLFNRTGILGESKIVELNETNSLSNVKKFIEKYPHFYKSNSN